MAASKQDRDDHRIAYLSALCRTVPYHIVERVLESPTEQSVTRQIYSGSVMYADIVGFTSLCERLAVNEEGSDHLSQMVNELFSKLLEEAVFPFAGYLVQFGGDSLTTFFRGADHARRAAAAALTCQRIMFGELGRLLGGRSGEMMLRIGVATGEVRVPVLGDYTRRVALCAGDTARRAMALQQMAQPNEVLGGVDLVSAVGNDLAVSLTQGRFA